MGTATPILQFVFDRHKRATAIKTGSVELRITYNRVQRFVTTGVRVLPRHWRNGNIINRLDSYELQQTLDIFMANARRIVNEQLAAGTLDMDTVVGTISGRQRQKASENVPKERLLMDFFQERALVRKYGRTEDSQGRYDRFLRWFESWGGMVTFADITEANIIKMDEALSAKRLKNCSKWNNYHRFLNSFILDAMEEGFIRKNPYKSLHIDKAKRSEGLGKYLTREEFARLAGLDPTTEYLRHARDLFVFQTYTCLSYTDLEAFDVSLVREVKGRPMYMGRRGKTKQEFVFMLLPQAMEILERYGGELPMMSNQKYNDRLKILSVMAGIGKPLSSHWARHTGATMLLNSGVGMEIVAKVLGHSSTKITREVYAKMLDETVAEAMARMDGLV